MAKKVDLNGGNTNDVAPVTEIDLDDVDITTDEIDAHPVESAPSVKGLSASELSNPDNIMVHIADAQAPIVVLFGPTTCGKTISLIRLTRYLVKNGYSVRPIKSFRPSHDTHYAKMCDGYNTLVNSDNAAVGTNMISFMLVEVLDKTGKRICQILEAPGEYYYSPAEPDKPFPAYVHAILNSNNRKIWVYMLEPNWKDPQDRAGYVDKIKLLKTNMRARDKAIFLYNKVDQTQFVQSPGHVNLNLVITDVRQMYPGIFVPFMNQNPITKWFKKYNCSLVPFSNGAFPVGSDATGGAVKKFIQGVDEYPRMLWQNILKLVRG